MVTLLYRAQDVGPVCQMVAKAAGNGMKILRDTGPFPGGTVVRWGSVAPGTSKRVINSAEAVALAKDKHKSREVLGDLSPETWFQLIDIPTGVPVVVRPKKHHGGLKFYVAKSQLEIRRAIRSCRLGWYASRLIEKKFEYRVFVLQGRIVSVSQRFPANPEAVAWNLALGGRLINCKFTEWPVEALKVSIEAATKLGLDWAAMDVAIGVDGKAVVFEANTAPGLRNPYTISRVAKALAWVESNDPPKPVKGDKWQAFIHPALK